MMKDGFVGWLYYEVEEETIERRRQRLIAV